MAIAPDGTPYVTWYENREIYVRRWNGSVWEEADAGSATGGGISGDGAGAMHPSMAVSPDGTPYAAWQSGGGEIHVRRYAGGVLSPTSTPTPTLQPVDLLVTKRDRQDPWYVGWGLGYDISVTNVGEGVATGIVVSDTLPASTYPLLEESTPGARYDQAQGAVIWEVESLQPGEIRLLYLVLGTLSTIPDGTIIANRVQVVSDQTIPATATEDTTMQAAPTKAPTSTPTATATLTSTPTATPTLIATPRNTPTRSVTPLPTIPPAPTATPTPGYPLYVPMVLR